MPMAKEALEPIPKLDQGALDARLRKRPWPVQRKQGNRTNKLHKNRRVYLVKKAVHLADNSAPIYFQVTFAEAKYSLSKGRHERPIAPPVDPRQQDNQLHRNPPTTNEVSTRLATILTLLAQLAL